MHMLRAGPGMHSTYTSGYQEYTRSVIASCGHKMD